MSIALEQRCLTVLLVMPVAVVFSEVMGAVGFRWPISTRAARRLVASLELYDRVPTLALSVGYMTLFSM